MDTDTIKLHCPATDKIVSADVMYESATSMTVLVQPGDLRLNLRLLKPNVFVGQMHGYEFVYKK